MGEAQAQSVMPAFAELVIPHTRLDALTYAVPEALRGSVRTGSAVEVELRQKKVNGIVVRLSEATDVAHPKPILRVLENEFCAPALLELTRWVSQYYVSSWGEAVTLAFPAKVIGYKPRTPWAEPCPTPAGTPPTLTIDQMRAVHSILPSLRRQEFKPFLLYGVTGSGKTEIYLRAVEETLRQNRAAIVLVPEIALTPLLISRFAERFSNQLVALHSGLRAAERKKSWQAVRDGKVRLVVGARSAVFAPVRDLGLVVVDEEHDRSYKEHERSPHYHARDVAVMRGKIERATVIIASATPSIESFYNARQKRYELLRLPKRIADRALPRATVVSLRRRKEQRVFSAGLVQALRSRMGTDEQVILFVNRRGFSRQIVCTDCGAVPVCKFCGVPLVYHTGKKGATLKCHFCQFTMPAFDTCSRCQSVNLEYQGIGTQQVVQELRRLFPGARVLRMDSDAMTKPEAYQQVLSAFEKGLAKFLVGTQMVTKGFDFPNVTLCAAVSADSALSLPDFRGAEQTFQVLTQVMGRAGRGGKPGQVFFQTLHPDHYAVNCAAQQNYEKFYETEIALRQSLSYPPFQRLALIRISSPVEQAGITAGETLASRFKAHKGIQVLGPVPAFRKRKRNLHISLLLLRAPRTVRFWEIIDRRTLSLPKVRVDVDIDPQEIV